jgi:hypothetical protein
MAAERIRTGRRSDPTAEATPPSAPARTPAAYIPLAGARARARPCLEPAVRKPIKRAAPLPPPKRRGKAPYVPTDQDRRTVKAMLAHLAPQAQIETVLGITGKTLRKYFRAEIRISFSLLQTAMSQSLADQGLGRPARAATATTPAQPAIPANVKATIAWLKLYGGAVRAEKAVLANDLKAPLRVVVELVG